MDKTMIIYVIGEKKYVQRPLVLGQIEQLVGVMSGLSFSAEMDVSGLVAILTNDGTLSKALAIVLTPDGIGVKDKDLNALAMELKFEIGTETVIQVVEDFFVCNPIASLLERLGIMAQNLTGRIKASGLKASSASSPEEMSRAET